MTKPDDPQPQQHAASMKAVVMATVECSGRGRPPCTRAASTGCQPQGQRASPRTTAASAGVPAPPKPPAQLSAATSGAARALPPAAASGSMCGATWLPSPATLLADVRDMTWQPKATPGAPRHVGLWTGSWNGRLVAMKMSTLEAVSPTALRARLECAAASALPAAVQGSTAAGAYGAAAYTTTRSTASDAAAAMLQPLLTAAFRLAHRNLLRVYAVRLAPLLVESPPTSPTASAGLLASPAAGSCSVRNLWWLAATSCRTTPLHQSFMDSDSFTTTAKAAAAATVAAAAGEDGRGSGCRSQPQGAPVATPPAAASILLGSQPSAPHAARAAAPLAQAPPPPQQQQRQPDAQSHAAGVVSAGRSASAATHEAAPDADTKPNPAVAAAISGHAVTGTAVPHIVTPPVHEGGLVAQRSHTGEPLAVAAAAAVVAAMDPAVGASEATGQQQAAAARAEPPPAAAAGAGAAAAAAGAASLAAAAGDCFVMTDLLATAGGGMSSLLASSYDDMTHAPQQETLITLMDYWRDSSWRAGPVAAAAAAGATTAQQATAQAAMAAAGATEPAARSNSAQHSSVSQMQPRQQQQGAPHGVHTSQRQHCTLGAAERAPPAAAAAAAGTAASAIASGGAAADVTRPSPIRLPQTATPVPPLPGPEPPRRSQAADAKGCAMVILMEYCDHGDLHTLACSPASPFRASRAWTLHAARRALLRTAREIAAALAALHAAGIVHGALWPSNILLARSNADRRGFTVRVADAGSESLASATAANALASTARAANMTLLAPESLALGTPVSSAPADVYAFGMLLYLMAAAEMPFAGRHLGPVLMGVASGSLRPEWPMQQHAHLAPLFAACLAHKPEQRPTSEQVHMEIRSLEKVIKAAHRTAPARS
ncbi:hypothetical protein HXX76_006635 [Chlamydomonas incerta]|uniref:Protein kinase domain-containing protein n=1 Tax=Chlamydomonas incerta TaxID=51695 RepID=A0A835TED3_CHLIN|nr:hypothetical protein HXX76_006635 [Chlamydomonas incerta]|eukprot:KAG2436325.1 hypothetical protein HXX76_006635 [Chlamydomonas incerta]